MAQKGKTHFPQSPGSGYDFAYPLSTYDSQVRVGPGYATGNVWFVSSTNANAKDSGGYGYSPEAPFKTIAYAVGTAAQADNDDLVLVLPGHVETITAAAGVAMSIAGVTVRGVGTGRQRPLVNYTTAAAASFDVTAARCSIENLTFTGMGFAAITAMINVKAADFTMRGCEVEHGNATNQAILGILTTSAANRMTIGGMRPEDGNFFHGSTDAGTTAVISLVGGNEITIANNRIYGSYAQTGGAIAGATTDSLNLTIAYNYVINRTAGSTKAVVLTASTTGCIADNVFGILAGTAPVTAAGIDLVGANYYKAATGVAAGTLL